MKRQVIISGLLGGVIMFVWLTFSLGVLRLGVKPPPRPLPDQAEVHAALKKRITEVGTYACLYVSSEEEESRIPNYRNEPLYSITYAGYTHNTVPGLMSVGLLGFLFAPTIAAWLLSRSSESILARYRNRLLFVVALGLFVATGGDWMRSLSDQQPTVRLLQATVNSLITWFLAGLVIAWQIKPRPKFSSMSS